MALRAAVARRIFACFLTAAAGSVAAPAFAQHVVTDNEAGKLTLDALTATPRPIFHRVVYRPARSSWMQSRTRSMSIVHLASFHHSVREASTMSHYGISRRRRRS